MLKIALSHDIDRVRKSYQYLTKTMTHVSTFNASGIWNQFVSIRQKKPYWTFSEFINIEKKYGIRSTVFFLNESIKIDPLSLKSYKLALGRYDVHEPDISEMIRFLDLNGWEIGVHGSYNSYQDISLLMKEKKALEKIVGHSVSGVRQHYLNLDQNTWKNQEKAGFLYDSSWGFTHDIGFKDERYLPFHPTGSPFKVIPLTLMDSCFMQKKEKWNAYERLLDVCEYQNAVMVVNFHQHVFHQHDYPGYQEAYVEIIERAIKRTAKFLLLSEV